MKTTVEVGYDKIRKQMMNIIETTAEEKGVLRKHRISDGWFRHFVERQPQLKGDSTAFVHMDATKKLQELDKYITLKNVLNRGKSTMLMSLERLLIIVLLV